MFSLSCHVFFLPATSAQVKKLAPQVVHASKIVFENPDNEVSRGCVFSNAHNRYLCKRMILLGGGGGWTIYMYSSPWFLARN